MPDLKLTLSAEDLGADKGILVEWVKELGDWVRKQEAIAVCSVDGREVSLKAPVQGVLKKINVEPGAGFDADAVLGILRTVMGGT
jgi:pyruvate/2-oxoglutarate dehydrogenase complex dihydrolipoamide acyltransferase (E2) component